MDTPLTDCRAQCYDGASNMVGANTGVATRYWRSNTDKRD